MKSEEFEDWAKEIASLNMKEHLRIIFQVVKNCNILLPVNSETNTTILRSLLRNMKKFVKKRKLI